MALFGGGNTQQGLALRITESGAEQVTGKLNRLAGATDRVAGSSSRSVGGFTRIGAAMGRLRGVATGLLGIFGRVGGLLGIGGAFAVGGLIGETLSIERNLRRIQYQGNLSAEAMRRMRDTMNQVAGNTGKSRAEVVAAIDVANDLGLSLEEAEKHMEQMALWSDLLGVSTDQAIGAVASIKRAVGDGASVDEIMSMVNAAAMNAGMDEGVFMNLVSKVGSQLQGMSGLADISAFFQAIAGIGEEFAGDPRVLQSAFKSLNRYMSNPKMMGALDKVGVSGKNAAELLLSMSQLLERDKTALDRAGLPDEVLAIAQAMVGNGDRINKMGVAVDNAAGDVETFAARVAAHKDDDEIAWASTIQQLKKAMEPLIAGVLNWVVAHKDEIVEGFKALIDGLGWLADGISGVVDWVASITGGPTSAQLKEIAAEEQRTRETADRVASLRQQYAEETDPGKRAVLAGRIAAETATTTFERPAGAMSAWLESRLRGEAEDRSRTASLLRMNDAGHNILDLERGVAIQEFSRTSTGQAVSAALTPQNVASAFLRAAKGAFTVMVNVSDKVSAEADVRAENRSAGALPAEAAS